MSELSPDIMKLMGGADSIGGSGTHSEESVQAGDNSGPSSSGMAIPTSRAGAKAAARIQVHLALNVLGKALTSFEDNEDDEAKEILHVMNSLVSKFGDTPEKELVPAQIMQLVKSEPALSGMQGVGGQMQSQQGAPNV